MTRTAESPPPLRVVVADDHALLADAMALLLGPMAEVVGTAHDGETLVRLVQEQRPALVLTDLSMPLLSGLDATRLIRQLVPPPEVIIVTVHSDVALRDAAFAAGARGYVVKSAAAADLRAAVAAVMRGERFCSELAALDQPRAESPLQTLTPREREVLALVAEGLTAKEIGARLGISERTVSFHKDQMKHRLGARSTVEMVTYFINAGKLTG